MKAAAIAFDFNGTLSDDEPVLARVYTEMIAGLTEEEYFASLAGHTDDYIFAGDASLIAERVARYNAIVVDGSTVDAETRAAVRLAAERLPVALVSAALRDEVEPVLAASDLRDAFTVVLTQDDVVRGKPDPQPYLLAAERLGIEPAALAVFEDTDVGVASARAAGAYVVGLTRTVGRDRMRDADELVERITVEIVERLCS